MNLFHDRGNTIEKGIWELKNVLKNEIVWISKKNWKMKRNLKNEIGFEILNWNWGMNFKMNIKNELEIWFWETNLRDRFENEFKNWKWIWEINLRNISLEFAGILASWLMMKMMMKSNS